MTIRLNDQRNKAPEIPAFLRKDTEHSLHEFGEAMFKKGEQTGELKERLRLLTLFSEPHNQDWDSATCNKIIRAIMEVE